MIFKNFISKNVTTTVSLYFLSKIALLFTSTLLLNSKIMKGNKSENS
jgi:hypothetical protein